MTPDTVHDIGDGNDFRSVRARLHNQSDTLQRHELDLARHDERLTMMFQRLNTMASTSHLDSAVENITLKINIVRDDVESIRKMGVWVIMLILGAVVMAVMALVLKR